jgi:benzoyl-CoA reductase/2-hydroxyglutaryl-CoA dehydratase subunit BcrC/BadD/HgdB
MAVDPAESIQKLKDQGHRVIGCLPLYPPVELFHSMGLTPVILWGQKLSGTRLDRSHEHLQIYACSVAHRLTELLLGEAKAQVDGIFAYNACDTLRNLREILQLSLAESGRELPFFSFHLPMTPRDQTDSVAYFKNEMSTLIAKLEETYQVKFSEDSFQTSVEQFRKARDLAKQLEQRVATGQFSFGRFVDVIEDSYFLTVEDQISLLESILGESAQVGDPGSRGRILVSGILGPPPPVSAMLEDSGLLVVGNDVATLARTYHYTPAHSGSVFDYYQDLYDNHHPCSTLLHSADTRTEALMQIADRTKARGFVFLGEKYCDCEYFEIPAVEAKLGENGVRTLQLEFAVDDDLIYENVRTRIEAFAELLSG